MRDAYNLVDRFAEHTGAAWFLIHHSSKGDQGGKRTTDVGESATAVLDPVELMRREDATFAEAETADEDSAMEVYLSLIGIVSPTPEQAAALVDVSRALELTADNMASDRQVIREARGLQAEHDSLADRHQKLLDARAAYQAFLERADLEETCLSELRQHADRQHQAAVAAGRDKLPRLANSRRELFDFSQHPPRLKTPAK